MLDHIVYDSFGNILTETNASNGDRFKFAGMQHDSTIGQYFDHARWYGPVQGRFQAQDPLGFGGGDWNLYRYVKNDVSNAVDESGLNDLLAISPDSPAMYLGTQIVQAVNSYGKAMVTGLVAIASSPAVQVGVASRGPL